MLRTCYTAGDFEREDGNGTDLARGRARVSEDDERRREEQERFVEDAGILMEREGFPRMAGRILGWLLICDPPQQSAGELARALQASRGSISTMTQLLIRAGLIERIGVPGERQDFFRFRRGAAAYLLEQAVDTTRGIAQLVERGQELVSDQPPANQERIEEIRDLYAFFGRELPGLIERWKREHRQRLVAARPIGK